MSTATSHVKSYKRPAKTLMLDRATCISCAGCVGTCPDEALDMFGLDLQVFQDKCTYCTICVRFCPVGALSIEKRAPQPEDNAMQAPKTPADFHWPAPGNVGANNHLPLQDGTP